MIRFRRSLVVLAAVLAAARASADLKVATSLEDLASIAAAVGGSHVAAFSLCPGYSDPHFVPAKPSLMRKVKDADVFVSVGLELDGGWLPLVLPGSRNPRIQPGAPGFVDASEGARILDKPTGTVSRAEGDVHPLGNPHYYMDPGNLVVIADHLATVFGSLDPANAGAYAANAKVFGAKVKEAEARWDATMAPYAGAPVVTFHKNFEYFLDRFHLKLFGTVEVKPGIPPTPRHLAELADAMKAAGVRAIVYQPYYDAAACDDLAKRSGGVALDLPTEVGGAKEATDPVAKIGYAVDRLAAVLKGGKS